MVLDSDQHVFHRVLVLLPFLLLIIFYSCVSPQLDCELPEHRGIALIHSFIHLLYYVCECLLVIQKISKVSYKSYISQPSISFHPYLFKIIIFQTFFVYLQQSDFFLFEKDFLTCYTLNIEWKSQTFSIYSIQGYAILLCKSDAGVLQAAISQ